MNDISDEDLMLRIQRADDPEAFAELFRRYRARITSYTCRLLGDADEGENLAQETFLRLLEKGGLYSYPRRFSTWLFTIARRLLLDRHRAVRRRGERVAISEGDAATEFDALDGMVADETQQRLRRAVDRLSPKQREVFTLRVTEGLTYKDIADVAGTTEGAARVHYHNAVRAIKEFLDD